MSLTHQLAIGIALITGGVATSFGADAYWDTSDTGGLQSGAGAWDGTTTLGADQTWTAGAGTTMTITGNGANGRIAGGGNDLILSGAGNFTFNDFMDQRFNGSGKIIMDGTGTVNLNGGAVKTHTAASRSIAV